MYCTTQCDWSSSSWLKGTITPAVIKGQKEHHQQLTKKIRSWIHSHPEEFGVDADDVDDDLTAGSEEVEVVTQRGEGKSLGQHLREIRENPVTLGMVGLCLVLLLGLIYEWTSTNGIEKVVVVEKPVVKAM
jgi:hypothetical protein